MSESSHVTSGKIKKKIKNTLDKKGRVNGGVPLLVRPITMWGRHLGSALKSWCAKNRPVERGGGGGPMRVRTMSRDHGGKKQELENGSKKSLKRGLSNVA